MFSIVALRGCGYTIHGRRRGAMWTFVVSLHSRMTMLYVEHSVFWSSSHLFVILVHSDFTKRKGKYIH